MGQRCADWFVLRQFLIKGTDARKMLMERGLVRACLGMKTEREEEERTPAQWLKIFCDGWFSAKVSTEPMMRGSANEGAVLKAM